MYGRSSSTLSKSLAEQPKGGRGSQSGSSGFLYYAYGDCCLCGGYELGVSFHPSISEGHVMTRSPSCPIPYFLSIRQDKKIRMLSTLMAIYSTMITFATSQSSLRLDFHGPDDRELGRWPTSIFVGSTSHPHDNSYPITTNIGHP